MLIYMLSTAQDACRRLSDSDHPEETRVAETRASSCELLFFTCENKQRLCRARLSGIKGHFRVTKSDMRNIVGFLSHISGVVCV